MYIGKWQTLEMITIVTTEIQHDIKIEIRNEEFNTKYQMLFLKELQSVKPGIIFNKVSTTTLWQSSSCLFTKYLWFYDSFEES